jgi:outer membrane lipoprotein-sorting protein
MENKIKLLIFSCILLFLGQNCSADEPNNSNAQINSIIEKLNQAVNSLKNLSAKIEYTHAQPLFETQTVRTGRLFYVKDANNSALRINFLTIKQDDSAEQNYREDYVFDGRKMTKIDYQSKSATSEQLAKDNAIEPFELVQDYFPIIGLAKPAELTQQFNIELQQKTNKQNFTALLLIPRENSGFFKTYKQVEIRIDPKNFLPFDFSALTSTDEKITIKLTQIDISTAVKRGVFDMVIPADFVQMQKK